jgi:histidinol phosphatase-like PHP family hydrolase
MVTVLRELGLRIVIFTDDHEPAHVHVFGAGEIKINLGRDGGQPQLIWAYGMTRSDIRKAMAVVERHGPLLLEKWRAIHGRPG